MAKGKKKDSKKTVSKYPPPVILKTWPGKLSDQEVQERHQRFLQQSKNDHVMIRISQVDWKYHDFFLVISINTPVLFLQHLISQFQHNKAVLPSDIALYKSIDGVTSTYDQYDTLDFNSEITRFSRENVPWPIGQPLYPTHPTDIQYLSVSYEVSSYMNQSGQKNKWPGDVFNNSLAMAISANTKMIINNRQTNQANSSLPRKVSILKPNK